MIIYNCPYTKHPILQNLQPLKPVGVMIHSTGADNPYLRRYVDDVAHLGYNYYGNHFNRPDADQTPHAFIGLDRNGVVAVAEVLPHDVACWGCGRGVNGSGNYDPTGYLQIEICEDRRDRNYFRAAWDVAVEYVASVLDECGLYPTDIISHKEAARAGLASNHADPEHWFTEQGRTMDDFRNAVARRLTNNTPKYRVQVGAFADRKNAQNYANSLHTMGINAFVTEVDKNDI